MVCLGRTQTLCPTRYDDGTAEYGAGLNQPGAQLAYQFDMQTDQRDTIVAVDIYFPRFGDDSNQVIQFQILRSLTNSPSDIIYQQSFPIQRNSQNKFWRIALIDQPAPVLGKFYIGWKQNSSAVIAVGLDKNTDSGNKIFSNISGTFEANTTLKGSLMIRPVFGKGNGAGDEVTRVNSEVMTGSIYPNPSQGIFYISSLVDQVEVVDLTGRKMIIEFELVNEHTQITLSDPAPGIYLLKTYQHHRWVARKIIIK